MPQGPGPRRSETSPGVWAKNSGGGRQTIRDFAELFQKLAQTSHFEVQFGGLPADLKRYIKSRPRLNDATDITALFSTQFDDEFLSKDLGLLCNSASLPTTSFATATIDGNFTGVTERFAHTRQYQEITLDFYVDRNYKSLLFLEYWMEFIASGSYSTDSSARFQLEQNYFFRMQYPDSYKSNTTKITKFDRDYKKELVYTFVGLFPVSILPIQVSYQDSQILKTSATFQFDRYFVEG
jgi:hypothetical protein